VNASGRPRRGLGGFSTGRYSAPSRGHAIAKKNQRLAAPIGFAASLDGVALQRQATSASISPNPRREREGGEQDGGLASRSDWEELDGQRAPNSPTGRHGVNCALTPALPPHFVAAAASLDGFAAQFAQSTREPLLQEPKGQRICRPPFGKTPAATPSKGDDPKGRRMSYGVRLLVSGDFACFTRPEMKAERVSYDVMTPSAARGILEAIHWKPGIRWIVTAIHVLRPIRFQSIRRNEVGGKTPAGAVRKAMNAGYLTGLALRADEDRQQRAATVLANVAYVIAARFEPTDRAGPDDNDGRHLDTFNRRARNGQCFHQPCLGTREFPARFSLIESAAPTPAAIAETRDLGFMLYDIDHAGDRSSMFFRAGLENGVVRVPAPDSPEIRR
jgi:CRISPR-associated protein Cas5d